MHVLSYPHGGSLIERSVADEMVRSGLMKKAEELPSVVLDQTAEADLEMLGTGALSPLDGFMGQDDFRSVVRDIRLSNGTPWGIPIVLGTGRAASKNLSEGQTVALRRAEGDLLGLLELAEIYPHDVQFHVRNVFGTNEEGHPGVERVLRMGDVLLAGQVTVLKRSVNTEFEEYCLTPRQLRSEFQKRGWKTVVAFQTRNPIHRAHEYLMKCALESTDGLLLHPLIGQTKADDLPADIRIKSYETLLRTYFNPARTMMSLFPGAMRYAGPREAVFHAIVRKNYGCTHFIVGRDHAGAKKPDGTSFYGPFDAHEIFDNFSEEELGIRLFFYDNAFYCRRSESIVTKKTAPDSPETRFELSGTKVRELLCAGIRPPAEITRPEVADVLIQALRDEAQARDACLGRGI